MDGTNIKPSVDRQAAPLVTPVRPLRILVVALNYAPELIGCAKYTTELAEELTARGHVVEVVASPPYYPAWAVSEGYSGAEFRREIFNGVPVHRTPLYVPRTPSGLKRVVHLASFGVGALLAAIGVARRLRPDVVFAVAPALSSATAALIAARNTGAKSWLHVQDFEVDAAFDLGVLKNRFARNIALNFERRLMTNFDRVSSISPQMVRKLAEKGVPPDKIVEFRNWVDIDTVQVFSSTNTSYRQELDIPADRIVALYSGNMAGKQGLEMLAEVARALDTAKANVTVLICGDGPAKAVLEANCAGLANVVFLPLQPAERLPELLGTADIHLLPQRPEAADLVLPSKLTGMLASGRPIVAMANQGSGLAAEISGCGRAVAATAEAMSDALLELVQVRTHHERRALGAASRSQAERRWQKSRIIDAFESHLQEIVSI